MVVVDVVVVVVPDVMADAPDLEVLCEQNEPFPIKTLGLEEPFIVFVNFIGTISMP